MPLASFVYFHEVAEDEPKGDRNPSFVVVLARTAEGVVLVFNLYRRVWELPGGLIDAGETPRDAAARELAEEAGAVCHDLQWLGLTEVNDGQRHFGAVYSGTVSGLVDHMNVDYENEIGGVSSWTRTEHPQPLGETDAALLNRFG